MSRLKFIDIAVNLTDPVYRGIHRGHQKHADDLLDVMKRCADAGVRSQIITGGSWHESKEGLELASQLGLYATVGCHPTRTSEFASFPQGPDAYLERLSKLLEDNLNGKARAVAVGECGLDYDRLQFSSAETQRTYFRKQLSLAKKFHLPLFLHSRAAHADLVSILREEGLGEDGGKGVGAKGGVVHSFTGTKEEADELIAMGYHIGINGCSLKTEEQLSMVSAIPLDKLLLETDAPWCSLTGGHASKVPLATLPPRLKGLYFPKAVQPDKYVTGMAIKGRNEPCAIGGVAWVVAKMKGASIEEVSEKVWANTIDLFGLHELQELCGKADNATK